MYRFYDNFMVCDELNRPYSLTAERSSALPHINGAVDSRGFSIQCPGNKYIFATPELNEFAAELSFAFFPKFMDSGGPYQWSLIFAYNEIKRTGYQLSFKYFAPEKELTVVLEKVKGFRTEEVYSIHIPGVEIKCGEYEDVRVKLSEDCLSGSYAGHSFIFAKVFDESLRGSLGLSRSAFIGEVVFRYVSIVSDEIPAYEEIIPRRVMEIPPYNGGQLPYRFGISVLRYENGKHIVHYDFDGGLSDRPLLPKLNGQYLVGMDSFTEPYIRLADAKTNIKIFLHTGVLSILDINVHWDFLKEYFECADLPISLTAYIDGLPEDPYIIFGYTFAESRNFQTVSGGPTEYVYDLNGNLIYMGESLESLSVTIDSGGDKKIVSMIPKDIPRYEDAVLHAVNNHYFFDDEQIRFDLVIRTPFEASYNVKAWLEDAYFTKLTDLTPVAVPCESDFPKLGLYRSIFRVTGEPLSLGVYHVAFEIWSGAEPVRTERAAFEVFDDDETHSPQKASGLPYLYSKCNEMRYLEHDVLDFLSPLRSYNAIHYYSMAGTMYADAGTKLQIWRLFRLYRREWLCGLSGREVQYPHWSHWTEAVKNASHVEYSRRKITPDTTSRNMGISRYDMFKYETYNNAEMLKLVDEYLSQRPEFSEKLPDITKDFNREKYRLFLNTCCADWLRWFAKKNIVKTKETFDEIRAINPNVKFSGYSPYPIYAMPIATHHTLIWYGYEPGEEFAREVSSGVAQFEDYPYSCSYPTHRGALAAAALRLWCPNLNLTPELYRGSRGGCPDGLVGYANPPYGKYWMPPYFQSTQILEYAFATPVLNEKGFDYWRSYGAMFADPNPQKTLPEFLIRWKGLLEHKPAKPLKAMVFITDYPDRDERIDPEFEDVHGWTMYYNISEANQCHLYAAAREIGLNAPIMTRFSCLAQINADMTDVIVLPSLCNISESQRAALRKLYAGGVALVAAGSVEGLEDLFGVRYSPRTARFHRICSAGGGSELVHPVDAEFRYIPDGAEVLVYGDGENTEILLRHNRTLLLNTAAPYVGIDTFMDRVQYGRAGISELFKDECGKALKYLSSPRISANCGLSAFIDENETHNIVLFDYSPMRQIDVKTRVTEYKVKIHGDYYTDAYCRHSEFPIYLHRENGYVRSISVKLRPQENMLITLK